MELNKPKHNLFRNGRYAVEGFIDIVKTEVCLKCAATGATFTTHHSVAI